MHNFTSRRPFPRSTSISQNLRSPSLQITDLVILAAAACTVVVHSQALATHSTFASFLGQGISLRHTVVAVLCLCTWRVVLVTVGVYGPARTVAIALLRWIIAFNSCAAVIGLVQVVLHVGGPVWRTVALFWTISLALSGLIRALAALAAARTRQATQERSLTLVRGPTTITPPSPGQPASTSRDDETS